MASYLPQVLPHGDEDDAMRLCIDEFVEPYGSGAASVVGRKPSFGAAEVGNRARLTEPKKRSLPSEPPASNAGPEPKTIVSL